MGARGEKEEREGQEPDLETHKTPMKNRTVKKTPASHMAKDTNQQKDKTLFQNTPHIHQARQ